MRNFFGWLGGDFSHRKPKNKNELVVQMGQISLRSLMLATNSLN